MSKKYVRGFTLIELLVVIAIIGLLSSVVMSSVNEARTKGSDAAIKSNVSSIRSQAAILYDTNGNYNKVCDANSAGQDTSIARAISAIQSANGGTAPTCNPTGGTSDVSVWVVATPLKTTGTYWCADSTGKADSKNNSGTAYGSITGGTTPALSAADATACN